MASKKLKRIFEKLYAERLSSWERFACSFVGNEAEAQDAVQEATTRTLSADPPLHTEQDVDRYMMRAIRTSALKILEKRSRWVLVEHMDAEHDGRAPGALDALLALHEGDEQEQQMERVRRQIEHLPPEQRRAIELLTLRDPPFKLREAAAREGAAISTMSYRLKTGLKQLADALRDEPGTGNRLK